MDLPRIYLKGYDFRPWDGIAQNVLKQDSYRELQEPPIPNKEYSHPLRQSSQQMLKRVVSEQRPLSSRQLKLRTPKLHKHRHKTREKTKDREKDKDRAGQKSKKTRRTKFRRASYDFCESSKVKRLDLKYTQTYVQQRSKEELMEQVMRCVQLNEQLIEQCERMSKDKLRQLLQVNKQIMLDYTRRYGEISTSKNGNSLKDVSIKQHILKCDEIQMKWDSEISQHVLSGLKNPMKKQASMRFKFKPSVNAGHISTVQQLPNIPVQNSQDGDKQPASLNQINQDSQRKPMEKWDGEWLQPRGSNHNLNSEAHSLAESFKKISFDACEEKPCSKQISTPKSKLFISLIHSKTNMVISKYINNYQLNKPSRSSSLMNVNKKSVSIRLSPQQSPQQSPNQSQKIENIYLQKCSLYKKSFRLQDRSKKYSYCFSHCTSKEGPF